MSDFCKGQVGDVVYSIPTEGDSPIKWFLKEGEKKITKAVNAKGKEVDFNPENFTDTLHEALVRAVEGEWEAVFQRLREGFWRIEGYKGGK